MQDQFDFTDFITALVFVYFIQHSLTDLCVLAVITTTRKSM